MTDLFIGGEWGPAEGGATFTTLNPADGSVFEECAEAGAPEVDRAVAAARSALADPAWAGMTAA
ncbi:aldehyde dehydrogenase family protein, partial [Streptosporangium canum]